MKKVTNKKLGSDFERELSLLLSQNRFWVHNFQNKVEGQPADIIAVKKCHAYLIDAKVCSNNLFPISRIEPNQHTAMSWWYLLNHEYGWFALQTQNQIYMVDYYTITSYEGTIKDFSKFQTLEEWLADRD